MALNPAQFPSTFGSARQPDTTVVTARRKALTENYQLNSLKDVPDEELWEKKDSADGEYYRQELKSRNLL